MDNYSQEAAWRCVEEVSNLNAARNRQIEDYLRQVLQHRNLIWLGIITTTLFGFTACNQGLLTQYRLSTITQQINTLEQEIKQADSELIREELQSIESTLADQQNIDIEVCDQILWMKKCQKIRSK